MNNADPKTRLAQLPDYSSAVAEKALGPELASIVLEARELEICKDAIDLLDKMFARCVARVERKCEPESPKWEHRLDARLGRVLRFVHSRLPETVRTKISRKNLHHWYLADFSIGILHPENARRYVAAGHLEDLAREFAPKQRAYWLGQGKAVHAEQYESSVPRDTDQENAHYQLYSYMFESLVRAADAIKNGQSPSKYAVKHLLKPRRSYSGDRSISDRIASLHAALSKDPEKVKRFFDRHQLEELTREEDLDVIEARMLIEPIEAALRPNPAALCEYYHHTRGIPREELARQYGVSEDAMRWATPVVEATFRRARKAL